MKGDKKRRASMFEKKYKPYNKGMRWPSAATNEVTSAAPRSFRCLKDNEEITSVTCSSEDVMFLRTRPAKQEPQHEDRFEVMKGNRIVSSAKMVDLINSLIQTHSIETTICADPQFYVLKNTKWGTAWKYIWKCKSCGFISKEYKLYEEIETKLPGPNAAATNLGLQAGLQDTPIGNTRMRLLLTSMNIPPPAKSSMQKTADRVARETVQLNREDMDQKLTTLKGIANELGCSGAVHGSFDGRYNSITIVSTKKPGQNSSQAIGVFAESMTENHFILDYAAENKLCSTGAYLRSQGSTVQCPGGHFGCTATIPDVAPHSEYEMGKEIANRLAQKGVKVTVLTTDQDAKAAKGFSDAYQTLFPDLTLIRQIDPTHLGKSQIRRCIAANFSEFMFPRCRTREEHKNAQKIFAIDVKSRCSLIFKKIMEEECGNLPKIVKSLDKAVQATILCYSGDCSQCRHHALVCGGGEKTSWWKKSAYLGSHNITSLHMTENDKRLLKEILRMRLSDDALLDTVFNYNTQQCESFNFTLSKSAPKNVNYARNFEGRCASAVLRFNNSQGESLKQKLERLGVYLSPTPAKALDKLSTDMRAHRKYAKIPNTKRRNIIRRGLMELRHRQYKNKKDSRRSDYRSKGDNSS